MELIAERRVFDIFTNFEKYVNFKIFILVLMSSFIFPELDDYASS